MYREEERMGRLLSLLSGLAVFIGCLGLLGLSAFTCEQRIKEIAIRKTLGATATQIVLMLNKEYTRWMVIAFFLGTPAAAFITHRYLHGFAYPVSIHPGWFALALTLTTMLAWISVSVQSFRAARTLAASALRRQGS